MSVSLKHVMMPMLLVPGDSTVRPPGKGSLLDGASLNTLGLVHPTPSTPGTQRACWVIPTHSVGPGLPTQPSMALVFLMVLVFLTLRAPSPSESSVPLAVAQHPGVALASLYR